MRVGDATGVEALGLVVDDTLAHRNMMHRDLEERKIGYRGDARQER